jgi:hypothetical protein
LLHYSRDPQENVTVQLQHPVHAHWSDTRFHGPSDARATKSR